MRLLIILFTILLFSCSQAQEKVVFDIKGISFEAPSTEINNQTLAPIAELGANWISIMPYAFTKDGKSEIFFNSNWQWRGEKQEGVEESIFSARKNNLKVMIKPHLWIHSKYTGDVRFETDEQWKQFENTYTNYILFYANLAEKHNVEMFCIGTELKAFINERPDYWNQLINEIRKVYSGKLTYAANWDNYVNIPFWKQLDIVGIDAYFPLSDAQTPTSIELITSWEKWWQEIEMVSKENNKDIIFTELGYRSIDYCAKQPWVSYEDLGNENQQAQTISLKAFFETAQHHKYFKGAFLWKWHCEEHLPKSGNTKYTFQNKEAEELVRKVF